MSPDIRLLFLTRIVRLFAYGALSVILVLYLSELSFSEAQIGAILSLTLIGDMVISLYLTTRADRFGRKRTLIVGALLMAGGGAAFALTDNLAVLLVAAIFGVISPTGKEEGPFLAVEQAALSHVIEAGRRTRIFAWYMLAGSVSAALGALACGGAVQWMLLRDVSALGAHRVIIGAYAALGVALALLFTRASPGIEVARAPRAHGAPGPSPSLLLGLGPSRNVTLKLAGLFALDAFGGGFIVQSLLAYWLHLRYGAGPSALGAIFFAVNALAGFSGLIAARLAERFGLVNTMVFTHVPSNVLLLVVPFMPTLGSAVTVLLLRFSISQMDVPTRQSYTMAVVSPGERSAAAGVTGVARTLGASVSPMLASILLGVPALINLPLTLAGGVKLVYDAWLYAAFRALKPPEEITRQDAAALDKKEG